VSGQRHALAALYLREIPGTHFTRGWVGPRAGLDGRKISSPPGFYPGPSSPKSVAIPIELPGPLYIYIYVCMYTTTGFHKLIIKQFIDVCLYLLAVFPPVHHLPASRTEQECMESYLHFCHSPSWHAQGRIQQFAFVLHMFVILKNCIQDTHIYDLWPNKIFTCDILGSHSGVNTDEVLVVCWNGVDFLTLKMKAHRILFIAWRRLTFRNT